jgi:hypothetical protein
MYCDSQSFTQLELPPQLSAQLMRFWQSVLPKQASSGPQHSLLAHCAQSESLAFVGQVPLVPASPPDPPPPAPGVATEQPASPSAMQSPSAGGRAASDVHATIASHAAAAPADRRAPVSARTA